jgi:nucleoside-diphosphate-sugar epimerase
MRVAIVGGTGMVGRGVLRAFIEAGDRVTVLHRGLTEPAVPSGVDSCLVDRRDDGRLHEAVAQIAPDALVDLACYTAADAEVTVAATEDAPLVAVISSVNAVGGPLDAPLHEETPSAPVSDYGRDKLAAEDALRRAWADGRSAATVIRLGPVHRAGCYLDGQLAEDAYWMRHALDSRPALLADGGEAWWNLLHAEDAGLAVRELLVTGRAAGTMVLVGSRHPLRWREFYALAHRTLGVSPGVLSRPADWWQERLGEPGFLHEMSRWNQVYRLDRLDRLAPGYQERGGPDRIAETIAAMAADRILGDADLAATLAGLVAATPAGHRSGGAVG